MRKPAMTTLVFETYTTSKANGMIEYGYTFKVIEDGATEPDDDTIFDLVLGESHYESVELNAHIQEVWLSNQWAAEAICRAYTK